jgi:protoporphyrinogen/coproporphyrinogen III oxidase
MNGRRGRFQLPASSFQILDLYTSQLTSAFSTRHSALQVAIIGGGITGLSAAYELATRGVPFVLLEASDRLGGLVRTDRVDGFTIDAGADSMLAAKPAGIALCEELGLGPRLMSSTPPRTAYVHARGRLYPLPSPSIFGIPTTMSGIASYGLLPLPARLRLLGSDLQLLARRRPDATTVKKSRSDPGDESVADFYRRHFGPATVSLIAQPLVGGIHAGDVEKLSVSAVAPRLVAAAGSGLLRRAATAGAPDGEGLFKALRGGMGELVSAMERRLPPGSVRLETAAQRIASTGKGWEVACRGGTTSARAVILASPAHAAAGMLMDTDPALAALCSEVPYASTVSVALAWPRASIQHPLAGSGFVVAREHSRLRITACTWVSSKWQDRAPRDMVLLRAFLGGAADPGAADLSDDGLVEIATRDVSGVLGVTGAPVLSRVQRWTRAGAQYNVGHAARLTRVDQRLATLPGLFVAGSGFHSIGVPDCVADGRAAGARAASLIE